MIISKKIWDKIKNLLPEAWENATKIIGDFQIRKDKYSYQSNTDSDEVNDTRFYSLNGNLIYQKCTVRNDNKGAGTWTNILPNQLSEMVDFTAVTTTSTVFITLLNSTITISGLIEATDCLVIFTAEVSNTNNDRQIFFVLQKNGLDIANSNRQVNAHPTRGNNIAICKIVNVINGDTISVQWRTAADTATLVRGELIIKN